MKVIQSCVALLGMMDFGASFESGYEDHSRRHLRKKPKDTLVSQESATKMPNKKTKVTSAPQGKPKETLVSQERATKMPNKGTTPKRKIPKAKYPKAKTPKKSENPETQYTITVTVGLNFTMGINADQLNSQEKIDSTAKVIEDGAQRFMPEGSEFNIISFGNSTVSSRRRLEISDIPVEGEVQEMPPDFV